MVKLTFCAALHMLVIAAVLHAASVARPTGEELRGTANGDYVCFGHMVPWGNHGCPCPSTSEAKDTCAKNVPLSGSIDSESQDCGMEDETFCMDTPGQIPCGQIYVCNVNCGTEPQSGEIECLPTQKDPPDCVGNYGCTPNES